MRECRRALTWDLPPRPCDLGQVFHVSEMRGPTVLRASFTGLKWASREYSCCPQARHPCRQALVWVCFRCHGFHPWIVPKSPVAVAAVSPQVPEWRSSCMRSWTGRCPPESPVGSCWLSTWQRQPVSWAPPPPTVSPLTAGLGVVVFYSLTSSSLLSFVFFIMYILII